MHISVPAYRFVSDASGQLYTVYEVYINGALHCSARYSSLLKLHELSKKLAPDLSGTFPPKKLKALLNDRALEERREALQDYLRSAFQRKSVAQNRRIQRLLLDLQRESCVRLARQLPDHLPVYLLDGYKVDVPCFPGDSSDVVRERVARALNVSAEHVPCFALFIVTKSDVFACRIIRWLGNFESPLLSLYHAAKMGIRAKVVIRKCIWDATGSEGRLVDDAGAVRILYAQAKLESSTFVARNGCLEFGSARLRYRAIGDETFQLIQSADVGASHLDFLKQCQQQPWYGYMFFEQCQCTYPKANTFAHAAVGNKKLILLYPSSQGDVEEAVFRITRIRAWRLSIISTHGCQDLSFEYLFSNNHLEWITLRSAQAVLISLSLQAMIEEMVGSEPLVSCSDHSQTVKSRAFLNESLCESKDTARRPSHVDEATEIGLEPIKSQATV